MSRNVAVFIILAVFLSIGPSTAGPDQTSEDAGEILRMHRELIEAHELKDVHKLLAPEPDRVFSVSGGEIIYQTSKERTVQFERYFQNTEFDEYRDLIDPIIRVSDDGSLGWLIAQVKISGTRKDDDGKESDFESVWAWIELYEKKEGRWYRIGDVSNVRSNEP